MPEKRKAIVDNIAFLFSGVWVNIKIPNFCERRSLLTLTQFGKRKFFPARSGRRRFPRDFRLWITPIIPVQFNSERFFRELRHAVDENFIARHARGKQEIIYNAKYSAYFKEIDARSDD